MDAISKTYFYDSKETKTKLNWLLYEYANFLCMGILGDKRLKLFIEEETKQGIIDFCVYFTNKMKESILTASERETQGVKIRTSYVVSYYPKISPRNINIIMKIALKEWQTLLNGCENCPTKCLLQQNEYMPMFEEIDTKGDYN